MKSSDQTFLEMAIEKAKASVARGGFPAGAVIVKDGNIIGEGISIGNIISDPTSHSEMASIRDACKNVQSSNISGSVLYASMSPCIMCLSAAMWSGVVSVVFACRQDQVSPEYYGGHYDASILNKSFLHPLKLEHMPDLELESLEVIRAWERKLTSPAIGEA
ncbi:MAG: nucleoside deaminase [Alphaproteobacteria bacterium]|nr:nucleoside deaminase [Alphaproteobacteria bacterium]